MRQHGSRRTTLQLLQDADRRRRLRVWWAQVIGLSAFAVAVALALWWRQ